MDDLNFQALYSRMMGLPFLGSVQSPISDHSTVQEISGMLDKGRDFLPHPFQQHYADPLNRNLTSVIRRLSSPTLDAMTMETLAGAVYQHGDQDMLPELHRFLAVISNMYRSFLDSTKRAHLGIELTSTLPPLAMFQSSSENGPFTITNDTVARLTDASVGVVSLPRSFAKHPLLFGSLAHETGGHDVIHADSTLLTELRANAHNLFDGPHAKGLGLLWDYWMDEAAADIYGVLNIGPSFGLNLALLLTIFIGQMRGLSPADAPTLRTDSGADDRGVLDPHPTDILRLSLIQGAVEALTSLTLSTRQAYSDHLANLAHELAPTAREVNLTGYARVPSGESMSFDGFLPLSTLQESARSVGAMIATARLQALGGSSIQDIETWDDADENAAVTMAGRLASGVSIVGLGDDAQILAATTLAALRAPDAYDSLSMLANSALDDSFSTDPYWGSARPDKLFLGAYRTSVEREVEVDPYAAAIIDFNPLDADPPTDALGIATVTEHAIRPIKWPTDGKPVLDSSFVFKGGDAELPKADIVFFTWTNAEANAMAAVLTPGIWAAPRTGSRDPSWHEYTNQWASKFAGRSTARGPATTNHYIGKYMPVLIGGRRVLLFKSNFHLARDDRSLPVKDMFKQVLQQTGARLAVTTGTAGAIGPKLQLGDVVVTNHAVFKLDGTFKNAPFNSKSFAGPYTPQVTATVDLVNSSLVVPNAAQLKSASIPPTRNAPKIFLPDTIAETGEPAIIVTTDRFEYDDAADTFHLQHKGAMVEMDDAVLGLACEELGGNIAWLAIRNASDPQMPADATKETSSMIYAKYGYWTSIPSVLASWAMARDFT
ncbi:phosphorylase family protein [Paraburkholderia fungorum]|uniref:phosphorylase family protein n=1 Tax=Paraburkholderia fungorum TaxID=134537 RepID=UPI0038BBFF3C